MSDTRRPDAVGVLRPTVFVAALIPAALLIWDATAGSLGANPIEEIEMRTGWWTLFFLLATLAVTPLRRVSGWNRLIKLRRMIGLFAFFYGTVHVSAFVGLDFFFDWRLIGAEVLERPWITIGMASWLLLVPLAVTSTKGWIRRLGGRRWAMLHRLVYLSAAGGTFHFFYAVKQDRTQPLLFAAILALLLGARIWWRTTDAMKAR